MRVEPVWLHSRSVSVPDTWVTLADIVAKLQQAIERGFSLAARLPNASAASARIRSTPEPVNNQSCQRKHCDVDDGLSAYVLKVHQRSSRTPLRRQSDGSRPLHEQRLSRGL
jgi:hypothetical protein